MKYLLVLMLFNCLSGYGQKKYITKKDTVSVLPIGLECKCLPGSYEIRRDKSGKDIKVYIEADMRTFVKFDTIFITPRK